MSDSTSPSTAGVGGSAPTRTVGGMGVREGAVRKWRLLPSSPLADGDWDTGESRRNMVPTPKDRESKFFKLCEAISFPYLYDGEIAHAYTSITQFNSSTYNFILSYFVLLILTYILKF